MRNVTLMTQARFAKQGEAFEELMEEAEARDEALQKELHPFFQARRKNAL